jgi:hypothetical protein
MAARVKTVKSARQDHGNCEKCGDPIKKGDPYRYFKNFRSSVRHSFCMKTECTPTIADTDQSKMATVRQAIDDAQKSLEGITEFGDFQDVIDSVVSAAEEVQQEYEEAIEAMPAREEQDRERIDALDALISDLQSAEIEPPEDDPEASDDENNEAYEQALSDARGQIEDALNSLEV